MRKILILISFFCLFSSVVYAGCDTHQSCRIGEQCACVITPSTAYDRYFYFDISGLEKGHFYRCTFKSYPTSPVMMLNFSTFPNGVTYVCAGAYPHFPVELLIDTKQMDNNSSDKMIIKYLVTASDYPSNIAVICTGN